MEPHDYVICGHVFGATLSASCSNYALCRTAMENEAVFGEAAANTLPHNFYVDDLLKSIEDLDSAKQLVKDVINMCKFGGFHLTKFISNNKELLLSLTENQNRMGVKYQDLLGDLLNEKALGICWNLREDIFSFKLRLEERTLTKRVMLSMISSTDDLLGFAAPFMLDGRRILQGLCNQGIWWDSEISSVVKKDWRNWVTALKNIERLHVRRCMKHGNFGKVVNVSLLHFSDDSELGYGQYSYIRMVDQTGRVHCSLLLGKSRVVPNKFISMPILELNAAIISIKMVCLLKKELKFEETKEWFWTDSMVAIGCIKNYSRRFKTFLTN